MTFIEKVIEAIQLKLQSEKVKKVPLTKVLRLRWTYLISS